MADIKAEKDGQEKKRSAVVDGFLAGWPIVLGYFPIGLAFGVLAQKAGFSPVHIGIMSLIVFAGSSQFIAVSMLASGASGLSVVLTTFVVNLRHMLMSSSLSTRIGRPSKLFMVPFAHWVTDESFAINLARFNKGGWDANRAMAVGATGYSAWFISTVTGGFCGQFIPESAFGIDYALIAMFICLLVFTMTEKRHVFAAVGSGVLAVVLSLLIAGNIHVVAASVLTAAAGAFVMHVRRKKEAG